MAGRSHWFAFRSFLLLVLADTLFHRLRQQDSRRLLQLLSNRESHRLGKSLRRRDSEGADAGFAVYEQGSGWIIWTWKARETSRCEERELIQGIDGVGGRLELLGGIGGRMDP